MEELNRSTFAIEKDRRFVWNSRRLSLVAFLIPFLVMTLAYAALQVFPFGNRHMLTVDLFHQYAPFLQLLRDKILEGGSPFYTLRAGLGVSFYGLFTYYLGSPLNLILLLFPAAFLTEGIFLITLVKVGLMGFAFFQFLQISYRRKGALAVAFSAFYALSGFTLAYSWNIMWLDTLIMLPVAVLALVRLIRDGKWLLFPLSVALILICNYYSGFFACIFLALYFPVLLFRYTEDGNASKRVILTAKVIALAGIGVALAAVLLYPTIRSLTLTSAYGDKFPKTVEMIGKPLTYLGQLFPFLQPTVRSGAPNLYCGLPVLFLLPVYFLSGRIRAREKILNGLLLLFIFLSFDINILNFIWHGMHYPNQLPYRYSFVAIFPLLAVTYDGLRSTREFRPTEIGLLGVCLGFIAPVVIAVNTEMKVAPWTQWGTIILLLIYALLFSSFRTQSYKRQIHTNLLLAVMLLEITLSTFSGIYYINANEYFGARDGYASGSTVASVREAVRQIESMDEDKTFYRMELKPYKTSNDPCLYGFNGFSLFASTSPKNPVAFFKNLGYSNNGINSYQYRGSTLFADSLFNIKYVIAREDLKYQDRERTVTLGNSLVTVYKNNYAFPLAFLAKPGILDFESFAGKPFANQNNLADAMIGENVPLFSEIEGKVKDGSDVHPASSSNTKFNFTRPSGIKEWTIKMEWTAERDGAHYLYLDMNGYEVDNVTVEANGESFTIDGKKKGISDIGSLKAGEIVQLTIKPKEKVDKGSFEVHMDALDIPSLARLAGFARERGLAFSIQKEDQLYAKFSCEEDSVLVLSVPYDPGWNASLDGEPVSIRTVDNALMAIPVAAGSHRIFMYYRPPGFDTGLYVSLGATGVLAILLLIGFILKKRGHTTGSQTPSGKETAASAEPNQTAEKRARRGRAKRCLLAGHTFCKTITPRGDGAESAESADCDEQLEDEETDSESYDLFLQNEIRRRHERRVSRKSASAQSGTVDDSDRSTL